MKRLFFICAVLFVICGCDNETKSEGENDELTLYQFSVDYIDDDGKIKLINSTNRSFIISNVIFLIRGHIVDAENLYETANDIIDIIYISMAENPKNVTLKPGDFILLNNHHLKKETIDNYLPCYLLSHLFLNSNNPSLNYIMYANLD